ncbi:alpha/beta hydrolase [Rhodococcus jostii]|uniref:Alpha/beta fold hydrolase n=1 Tax=Rhodococcus jostii TaxID=132919 RepID=A0ABU4CTB5_RHOJO|nr:alpha/beta fold hydrolase [Rhodococcus jostii]MDV6286826.1 alpha/beta fold hydrolase [Rhodococcus jostii]
MALHVQGWGTGQRVAVLIHGLGNSSDSWWQVGPALADHGYRVLAVDLPGHGRSAPLDVYGSEALAAAVVASVPARPAVAIGHSLGGLVLAHAVADLQPELAVYEDPAFTPAPDPGVAERFRAQKNWALTDLEREHPRWNDRSRHTGPLGGRPPSGARTDYPHRSATATAAFICRTESASQFLFVPRCSAGSGTRSVQNL